MLLPLCGVCSHHSSLPPLLATLLALREGLQCIWGYRGFGARLASMLICLCSVSSGQFYLLCWCHATQRSRPSSRRWTTTAIPSPRTLTSPRASSRRAIFQVGPRSADGPGASGPTAPFPPTWPSPSPPLCMQCWPRTQNRIPVGRGPVALAPCSLMMLFLARRSSGVTLPPGLLRAVIYFGSGNSDAVFLSPPLRPGPEYRQHPPMVWGLQRLWVHPGPGSEQKAGL